MKIDGEKGLINQHILIPNTCQVEGVPDKSYGRHASISEFIMASRL